MSLFRLYGSTKGMPFHRSTMTSEDVPMPKWKRPGAASASVATHIASVAGPLVKDGTMPVPSLRLGAQAGSQRQGHESVRAVRLGRPDVAVAESHDLFVQLLMVGKRGAVVRHRDTEAGHRSRLMGVEMGDEASSLPSGAGSRAGF